MRLILASKSPRRREILGSLGVQFDIIPAVGEEVIENVCEKDIAMHIATAKAQEVFEKYPDKLSHMHLHDSDGAHPHLPLGGGRIDVKSKLAMLREDSTCLIEVKTVAGLTESVKYLKNNL